MTQISQEYLDQCANGVKNRECGSTVYPFGLCGTVRRPRQLILAAQDRATRIDRRFVQHFLDTDQLIVFCQPI